MADNILRSYGDSAVVEDVVENAIEILTAEEEQISNMLERTEAQATVHEYLTDTLASAGINAQNESGDYSYNSLSTPTRNTNVVQHIRRPFRVSDTQRNVEHYHGRDELERQTEKALREFANDMEFNLVRATQSSGSSGSSPQMDGIINGISTANNTTTHNTVAWDATVLEGLMENNWDVSNGDVATDVFMGAQLRADTDEFTQKTNTVVNNASMETIIKTVTSYETAFGTVRIHLHRYVQQPSDATGRVLAINPDKLALAFLERPNVDNDIARTGPFTPRAVKASMTLEVRNKDSNWFADGFSI